LAGPQRRLMRQTLTFVKPGVMIDCASGSAKTEFLRFEEVARKGTILEASCGLNAPEGPAREAASALLVASAMLVERLGGKRRRGSGRCRLEIIDADTATALDWLKRTTSPPDWPAAPGNGTVTDVQQAVPATGAWVAVPLALRLNGPLAVSYRTVGNVVETLDFVPGSYLLPHVTGQWPQLRPHVAAGEVVVLPAYLEVDGERGLPVPIAWFQPKDAGKDAAVETHPSWINRLVQAEPPGEIQFKQLREGYISAESKPPRKPPPTVRTHNTVDDRHQRPTPEAGGGVYSYEAIAPTDQDKPVVLRSELRLKKSLAEQLGANWWRKLDGEVALGRSKKDDYGSVTLETREPTEFRSTAAARSDRLLFVWIVSDTLLRNERLKPEPTAAVLARELGRKLGVRLSLRASNPQSGLLDEMVRVRRLDSWHVGWGLPRPTLIALQAGSCVVFQAEGDLDPAKLAQLEASGVGERTAEGYGQVRFNDRRLTEPPPPRSQDRQLAATQPDTPHSKDLPSMDASTQEYAWRIESECWKQEIRRKCLAIAADSTKRRELLGWVARGQQGQPPMSQLGGLRGQLTFLRSRADRKQVTDWLEHLEQNPRRAEKWPSIKSVKKFLTEDSAIWQVIDPHSWPTLT
ncbi:MAG: hypothetical protein RMJ52_06370, partial [Gemmataceae bacterium]|nr:hypothetical protein [Gemmataceae bacterium]